MTKLLVSFLLLLSPLQAQSVLDSVSNSGNQGNVKAGGSFAWSNVTGTNANRALVVAVTEADLPVQGVTLGGTPLVLATSCSEPQYMRHAASMWTLAQPPSGTATITVTLGGATQFHSTARDASAIAWNLSNADPNPVDKVACHVSPVDSRVYVQSESLTLTLASAHETVLLAMIAPNTNDAAKVFNWPGTEDQLFVANSGDVSLYSHVGDSLAPGSYTYRWDWQNFEPVASVAVAVRPFTQPPPSSASNGITWSQGNLSDRPATCSPVGLNIFLATDIHVLFWCVGPDGQWQPPAPPEPLPAGDDWAMAFHDAAHTGRSSDVVTPPLSPLWQWSNNVPYDANVSAFWSFSLPIAFGNKVCFQGGKNANRVFCLHQDRSFAFEADNSGYTESSGSVFQFLDYPVMASDRIVFGSTDFTTTVSANDGGGFFNIYNTNGGWPYGGSTAHGGTVIQQFIETDSGMEDLVVYQALESLGQRCTWKQTEVPGWDMSLRVPATDGKTIYATINRRVTAFDANTCAILWSVPIGKATGVSPAVSAGVAYFHNGTAMMALDGSSPLWVRVMPTVLSPIVDRGVIYGGAVDGTFWALRASDGSTLWSFQTQAAFTPAQIPALSGNLIYVPSADGRIYTLDAATGRQVDRFTGAAAWGPIIIAHGLLYSSDLRGNVYAFRPSSAR